MSLTQLSPLGLVLGLGALAGALFLLQRLRVRHEERVVVTTLFWREATEESRARSLVERFRHPLAYLMALLVAGLLWVGVARPDSVRAGGTRHVLLLDGSAGMAIGGRFERAVDALRSELRRAPRDRTEVLWCGAGVRSILGPGEDRALLDARLEGLAPEATPASIERAVRGHLLTTEADGAPRRYVVVGDAPVSAALVARLGADDSLQAAELPEPPPRGRGITALGVSPAASGNWSAVDVLVEVRGPGADGAQLEVAVDGGPPGSIGARTSVAEDHVRHLLRGVPARGGLLRVALSADELPVDDVATIRLPDRPPIRVALDAGIRGDAWDALHAALAADGAVEIVADPARADVRVASGAAQGGPTLSIVPASEQEEAILVGHRARIDSRAALVTAVGELGLDRIDASALADALDRPIAVGAAPAPERTLSLWSELFDAERTSFVESRAFPLLVGRAVRWLSGAEPLVPYAAAARPTPRRVGDPAREVVILDSAGESGVSLVDVATTAPRGAADRATLDATDPEGAGGWRPYTWFLLLALLALGGEWALFQRGRMP
ncbi:MAG: VWA domain-containing protein [Planctomycetota bacterium]